MSQKKSLAMILVFWAIGFLLCGGCATTKHYVIQTSCPDLWDSKPKQNVSFKIEFRN